MAASRLERYGNTNWASVVLNHQQQDHYFPCYIPTGEIFNHDPHLLIRGKCFAIVIATPLVTLIRSVYCVAKTAFIVLSEFYGYLDAGDLSQDFWLDFSETATDSVRVWGYGTLLTGYAMSGMLFPYWARQRYGNLERKLNRHPDKAHYDKFYLAPCFQRIYLLPKNYPQNSDLVEKKLERYLNRMDDIRSLLLSCNCRQILTDLRILRPISA